MDITQVKGNLVELQCIMKFMSMGFECSTPYGNQAKYDILVDIGDEILRIQCKKSRWMDNKKSISFSACSQTTNTQKTVKHSYTSKDIDYFATCWEDNVYLIPVEECSTSKSLRMAPKEKNTPSSVNMAEDYLVENILGHKSLYHVEDFEEQVPIKVKKIEENPYYCKVCNTNKVWKQDGICVECNGMLHRKVKDRPSREILKEEIRNNSFLSIGKKYKVSDNAIRKWCVSYNLPTKKREINKYTDEEWKLI